MQKNKRFFQALIIPSLALLPVILSAQVVVGSGAADGSAVLEIKGNNRGVLLPRLSTTQRNAVTSPATGLIIYNTSTNCLEVNTGTTSTPSWSATGCRTGTVSSLNCAGASVTGTLQAGQVASGTSVTVPYTGGNDGRFDTQIFTSTGVTGLTATLSGGYVQSSGGNLSLDISGTPGGRGTAVFPISVGGQTCNLSVAVAGTSSGTICGAYVGAGVWKQFSCYNQGVANTSADPFTPGWEINGAYYWWGVSPVFAPGPTGPGSSMANSGSYPTSSIPPDNQWMDNTKTSNDPCPSGFRVPTRTQLQGLADYNEEVIVGTWTTSSTNYSAGIMFGTELLLPTAGSRTPDTGVLSGRGAESYYWSSSMGPQSLSSYYLSIYNNGNTISTNSFLNNRNYGMSVRCIKE